MVERSPEEQRIDDQFRRVESHFADHFSAMETTTFIETGVAIFRSSVEGFPVVNEGADAAVRAVLNAVVKAKAPEPFMGGRTAVAWRMFTSELIRRTAANQSIEFRKAPIESLPVMPYICDGWKPEDEDREILNSIATADRLLENFKIGGDEYVHDVAQQVEKAWYEMLALENPDVNPVTHYAAANNVSLKYEACFTKMVEAEDSSIIRRGLSLHDCSHVVEFVDICARKVNKRRPR